MKKSKKLIRLEQEHYRLTHTYAYLEYKKTKPFVRLYDDVLSEIEDEIKLEKQRLKKIQVRKK